MMLKTVYVAIWMAYLSKKNNFCDTSMEKYFYDFIKHRTVKLVQH